MKDKRIQKTLFGLIRLGIGNVGTSLPDDIDWRAVQALAIEQGLSAVVLDGIEALRVSNPRLVLPEKKRLTQWIGDVLQNYESRYESYRRTIAQLAGFYNGHGCKMMVLKGFACCLNWPHPEHRPIGDIDIWQFGDYKKADDLLQSKKGIKVDNSHHHHTVFCWGDYMVENHYDFINVHHHRSNVELEKEFKRLGKDDSNYVEVLGEKVYLPSPNLHALFLLKHTMSDFTTSSMTIKQLLDWAFYVQKHEQEIDWLWLKRILEQYHMMDFFCCINAICVEDLGFDPRFFQDVQFNPLMKSRVLNDILYPKYPLKEPARLLPRLIYKFRRWKGNAWKHKMCYKESMWSAFWSGVWNHLLKPKSI